MKRTGAVSSLLAVCVGLSIAVGIGAGCATKQNPRGEEPAEPVSTDSTAALEEGGTTAFDAQEAEAETETLSLEDATALCVTLHEEGARCVEAFAELLVSLRAQRDPRFASILEREGVRESVMEEVRAELLADGAQPLEARQQKCAEHAKNAPPVPAGDSASLEACSAVQACPMRVECMRPVLERRFRR